MSEPAVAPRKPHRITTKIDWWRAAVQAAAVSSSASPGKGTPALSTRIPMPANGPLSTSTREGQSTRVHILDDPMPDYGEHEATDDPLQVLRHSTAHLLAAAVVELHPEAKYGIGPAVQDGFYYDFDFGGKSISEADLPAIESRMRRLAQADIPFVHEVLPRKQAIEEFAKRDQIYKVELIHDKVEGDEVSVYRTGEFLDLCRQSGHAQLYSEYMYPPMKFEDGEELELRPVNCPHHIVIYQTELRSYRDLPLRIAEIGNNWRYERSGTLAGMNRVRAFALNDAHIFCTPDQLMDEVKGAIDLALYFSKVLGIDEFSYQLSTRDDVKDKWLGTEEQWEDAQAALAEALESMGQTYKRGVGDAAFYGPKIDFQVRDAHRREFTNSTVQVDFQLPQRFDLEYVAEDGTRKRPVMVHRGAAGAMERLFSYLIERYAP